ncbi:MAG: hypothetical protein E7295_04480 [Lachnospiraceae bacterium]|jgi:predicted acetyltransferase|nr:hypothetical protein [Lachnospiraceae bacterium]
MITLKRPNKELEKEALAFKQEFIDYGEPTINGSELLDQIDSYEEWLKSVTDNTSPDTVNLKNGGRYKRSFLFEGEEADVYMIDLV